MNWQVEWLDEAKKDMRKLGKAEQIQVLKGIEKVRTNPLPTSQGGYGKPLRNAERTKLSRLCKIKFRDIGIRVVYKPLLRNGIMTIIVLAFVPIVTLTSKPTRDAKNMDYKMRPPIFSERYFFFKISR